MKAVLASSNAHKARELERLLPGWEIEVLDADDYPPETGERIINPRILSKMPKTKYIDIPISDATRGHGTHTVATVWKQYLIDFLAQTEKK